jgi:hypothetical protein
MPGSNRISGKSLTARRGGESLAQEPAAETQTVCIDTMPDPLRHVPFDRKPGLGELLAGDE